MIFSRNFVKKINTVVRIAGSEISWKLNCICFTRVCLCVFVMFFLEASIANADSSRMRCNVNSECRPGFVCVGGIGGYVGTEKQTGCCEIILPLRQVCLFHNIISGKFGRAVVALVVISMGLTGLFGKLSYRSLLTFFVGTVCLFGSYQVVHFLTGYNYQMCELVDTSVPPGKCPSDTDDD